MKITFDENMLCWTADSGPAAIFRHSVSRYQVKEYRLQLLHSAQVNRYSRVMTLSSDELFSFLHGLVSVLAGEAISTTIQKADDDGFDSFLSVLKPTELFAIDMGFWSADYRQYSSGNAIKMNREEFGEMFSSLVKFITRRD